MADAEAPLISREKLARVIWGAMLGEVFVGKIQTIKIVRDFTGLGLKESKDAVEAETFEQFEAIICERPRFGLSPNPFAASRRA